MRELIERRLVALAASASGEVEAATVRGDHDLNPDPSPPRPERLVPAAVLVPLVERPEGLSVLLTQRTTHLRKHAGQISFPGGRLEPCDDSPEACALRETEEELGLDRRFIRVIGRLDTYVTVTGFSVTPVVGIVQPGFTLAPDPSEVAEAFEVPLGFLLDPANHQRHSGIFQGLERHWYAIPYRNHYIWGATAGMLMDLYRKVQGT